MAANERKFLRCGVYTRKSSRKSSEHGPEQDFNSLDAQREAAEAYIKSQAHVLRTIFGSSRNSQQQIAQRCKQPRGSSSVSAC